MLKVGWEYNKLLQIYCCAQHRYTCSNCVRLSVYPSVGSAQVLCRNNLTYCHLVSSPHDSAIIPVL